MYMCMVPFWKVFEETNYPNLVMPLVVRFSPLFFLFLSSYLFVTYFTFSKGSLLSFISSFCMFPHADSLPLQSWAPNRGRGSCSR
jgi:hypothetical protein